ncbi:unnamed protein product [Rotaria magnacalcarata]|uniref:Uncharacterized protein n=1 Tax=Rotaria magnacalcarata TaxID=392030 RepID=A0A816P9U3_9BILA|nr:unnamed protein product [Rotaria magnacalcarata]
MVSDDMKKVKFVYQSEEKIFYTDESIPLDQFLIQVKTHFNIAPDVNMGLMDIEKNISLCPVVTGNFWYDRIREMPVYKIIIRKCDQNDAEKHGWCRRLYENYIIPFLRRGNLLDTKKMN